jgi:spore coat protein I
MQEEDLMKDVNDQIVMIVLEQYGINPNHLIRVRKKSDTQVWRVTDSRGRYALKLVKKCSIAERIVAVNEYLHQKGLQVVTVMPPAEGKAFVSTKHGCFVLFLWLEGETPSYETPGMIERMAVLLARFHEASRGYVSTGGPITDHHLDLNEIYKRKIGKMEMLWEKAHCIDDPFTKLFLGEFPWLRARFKWVLDHLPHTALRELVKASQYDPILGHGDYSHINLILGNNDQLTVIDLDRVSVALPVKDISNLITWINHVHGSWSAENLNLVISSYQQVRGLSAIEQELILIDQIFPHRAFGLVNNHLNNKQNQSIEELERCLTIDRKKISYLRIDPS